MSKTVKYILIGGGVAAAVYLVARAMRPTQTTPTSPTAQVLDAAGRFTQNISSSISSLFGKSTDLDSGSTGGGLPYGTMSTSDGIASTSGGSGYGIKTLIPAPETYSSDRTLALQGIYS
jgi:hypothetical protein